MRTTRILCMAAAVLLTSFSTGGTMSSAAPKEKTISLMSYNVGAFRKYSRDLGHYSFKEVACVIRSVDPCIVGLNETDWEGKRSGGIKQAKELSRTLGRRWAWEFYPAGYTWYGNSIVWDKSRCRAKKVYEPLVLEKTEGSEIRSMGAIEFKDFVFCTTHLDHVSEADRLNAVDKISAWAAENYGDSGKPVFLVGDMNAKPSSATVEKFRENWIQLSGEAKTHPSGTPRKCIDYIVLFRNGGESKVELISSGTIYSEAVPEVSTASDHCPVWVTVRLKGE